jgi:hypothetical protein
MLPFPVLGYNKRNVIQERKPNDLTVLNYNATYD